MKRTLVFSLVAAAAALSASPASATIIQFLGTPTVARSDDYSFIATAFTVPDALPDPVVNQLGYWDENGDGLAVAHEVGIGLYSPSPDKFTVLTKATIPAGTGATLSGGYRWVPIAPITLSSPDLGAGTYQIFYTNGTDTWFNSQPSTSNSFGVLYTDFGFFTATNPTPIPGVGGAILFSAFTASGSNPFGGGNLGYQVPEPTSLAMLLFGVIALVPFARWRKRAR